MAKTPALDYRGRFAPSPTGPLHAGSLVAALASWLDAKAHGGQWLVRIEDTDTPRCVPGADQVILQQLAACGLQPDEPPVYQSQRAHLYQTALDRLIAQSVAYRCGCTRQVIRQDMEAAAPSGLQRPRHAELVYPGTCRAGLQGKNMRSWRFLSTFYPSNKPVAQLLPAQAAPNFIVNDICHWTDRRLGAQTQNVSAEVGDFIVKRADGLWAYQLAVVVDDAAQGITHIVRGEDLADNTARQILLQRALGLPRPQYLHTPLVRAADGQKLSKQNDAQALDTSCAANALTALRQAGSCLEINLGFETEFNQPAHWLAHAVQAWRWRLEPTATVF